MKKFLMLIVAILAFCCMSCTGNVQTSPDIDSPLPWQCDSTFMSERCKYDVVMFFVGSDNIKYAVSDNGYLEYKISVIKEGNNSYYSLETHFLIHYVDNEYNEFGGLTDEITSTAVFNRGTFDAVRTQKTATLQTSDLSYSFSVDYNAGTAVYDEGDAHIEKTFSKGSYIDNEYLYYFIRSFKNLGNDFDMAFNVINWHTCFKSDNISANPIRARFSSKESVSVPSDLLERFADNTKDTSEGESNLISDTMLIVPTGTAKTGQPIRISYASGAYISGDNPDNPMYSNKIISKMLFQEYNLSGALTYATEYNLVEVQVQIQ